jgi:hypothetical protein
VKPHLRRVPLTSVARTYPARTTQDSHRYILKCITTSESAPSLLQYDTIAQSTQHKTDCCYVITLTPYTRSQQLAKRHAASICDCSKLTVAWCSLQCSEGARPARERYAANFRPRARSSPRARPIVDGALLRVTHSDLLRLSQLTKK